MNNNLWVAHQTIPLLYFGIVVKWSCDNEDHDLSGNKSEMRCVSRVSDYRKENIFCMNIIMVIIQHYRYLISNGHWLLRTPKISQGTLLESNNLGLMSWDKKNLFNEVLQNTLKRSVWHDTPP